MTNETQKRKKPGPKPGSTRNSAKQAESREDKAHSAKRPPRVRMVAGQRLAVAKKDDNYQYRWWKDSPGKLDACQAAWWEFVSDEIGRIKRHSGPDTMYLMRIEKKYYEEDQKLKQENIKNTLRKENDLESDEYIPEGRHHALQKDDYDPLG